MSKRYFETGEGIKLDEPKPSTPAAPTAKDAAEKVLEAARKAGLVATPKGK